MPGDTNGVDDVFVKDLQTGATTRVSTDSAGNQGDDRSGYAGDIAISADGRYVVFGSDALNLVPGSTRHMHDIFLKDTRTGRTTRVTNSMTGAQPNWASVAPTISADGRYVGFFSGASDLVPGDTNANNDAFVKDVQTGTTVLVSTDGNGNQGNKASTDAALSADGRYITFRSSATNLVPGDTNGKTDIFRVTNPFAPADPPHVVGVTPNLTTVTDNNLGTAKFQVRIAFDRDMNLSSTPTLILTPNVAGTLTQSAAWWINNRIFYAQYDVTDADVNVSNISLVVWGAKDASGNAQAAYNGPSGFSIDTQSPAPAPARSQAQRRAWRP